MRFDRADGFEQCPDRVRVLIRAIPCGYLSCGWMHAVGERVENLQSLLLFHCVSPSDKSAFRERHAGGAAYDEMVENLHVDQSEGVLERLSQSLVGAARLGDARGM